MKAVILAGGRGERFGGTGNKCMTYYKGRPILFQSINNAVEYVKPDEIIILVGYKPDEIINYFGDHYKNTPIKYAFQPNPMGIVDALSCCKHYIKKDDFFLMLGDEILFNPKHKDMVQYYKTSDCFAVCGMVLVKNKYQISKTYNIIYNKKRIFRLIEKPSFIFNNLMGTGNCVFHNKTLDYIDNLPVNTRRGRQEQELVDLIQYTIDEGNLVEWFIIGDKYENVNDENCLLNLINWDEKK